MPPLAPHARAFPPPWLAIAVEEALDDIAGPGRDAGETEPSRELGGTIAVPSRLGERPGGEAKAAEGGSAGEVAMSMSPSAASSKESIEPDRRCESPPSADEADEADEAREVLEVLEVLEVVKTE